MLERSENISSYSSYTTYYNRQAEIRRRKNNLKNFCINEKNSLINRANLLSDLKKDLDKELNREINNVSSTLINEIENGIITSSQAISNRFSEIKKKILKLESEKKLLLSENNMLENEIKEKIKELKKELKSDKEYFKGYFDKANEIEQSLKKIETERIIYNKNFKLKELIKDTESVFKNYTYAKENIGKKDFNKIEEELKRKNRIIRNTSNKTLHEKSKNELINQIKLKIDLIYKMDEEIGKNLEKELLEKKDLPILELEIFFERVKKEFSKIKQNIDETIYYKSELESLIAGMRLPLKVYETVKEFFKKKYVTYKDYKEIKEKIEALKLASENVEYERYLKNLMTLLEESGYKVLYEETAEINEIVDRILSKERELINLRDGYKVMVFLSPDNELVTRLIRVTNENKDEIKDKEMIQEWCNKLDKLNEILIKNEINIEEVKREIVDVDYYTPDEIEEIIGKKIAKESKVIEKIEDYYEEDEIDYYRYRYDDEAQSRRMYMS